MFVRYLLMFTVSSLIFVQSVYSQAVVDSFPAPGSEPRGLAWDGNWLWCGDAENDSVYKMDPLSGTIISSFPFLIESNYGGLTWGEDSTIWIANGGMIYQVNPTNGDVIYSFSCPGG